jgi:hypothetical protein
MEALALRGATIKRQVFLHCGSNDNAQSQHVRIRVDLADAIRPSVEVDLVRGYADEGELSRLPTQV